MSTCRSCGAPVRWVRSANNKPLILDRTPSTAGQHKPTDRVVVVNDEEVGTVYSASALASDTAVYTAHWATCPQAAAWRRPR